MRIAIFLHYERNAMHLCAVTHVWRGHISPRPMGALTSKFLLRLLACVCGAVNPSLRERIIRRNRRLRYLMPLL